MLLLIPKKTTKTYVILLADGLKTILDLECVQIVRIHNMCKMKTIDILNVIMVLNNDVKMINQVLPFCIIYGPGYDERYLLVAIIKIRLMSHLQSITCLEHVLKI